MSWSFVFPVQFNATNIYEAPTVGSEFCFRLGEMFRDVLLPAFLEFIVVVVVV